MVSSARAVALNRCVMLSPRTLRKRFPDSFCKSVDRYSGQEMVVIDHNAEKLSRAHEFFHPETWLYRFWWPPGHAKTVMAPREGFVRLSNALIP